MKECEQYSVTAGEREIKNLRENVNITEQLHEINTNLEIVAIDVQQVLRVSQETQATLMGQLNVLQRTVVGLAKRKVPTSFCIVDWATIQNQTPENIKSSQDRMSRIYDMLNNPTETAKEIFLADMQDAVGIFLLCECCCRPQQGGVWPHNQRNN